MTVRTYRLFLKLNLYELLLESLSIIRWAFFVRFFKFVVMKITLEVANSKAAFLMELLKSLKFVKVTETADWFDSLSDTERKSVEQGMSDLKSGKAHKHQDVISDARKKLGKYK